MITYNLREFLGRSTDKEFDETTLGTVLSSLPALSSSGPWLAGGALRRTLLGKEPDSDLDFFFKDADQLLAFRDGLENAGLVKVRETKHHMHYRGPIGESGIHRDVQLIRFAFYENAEAVIDSFDFTVCMFAFDGETLTVGDHALWDLGRKRLAVHKISYPVATMRRLLKYANQGFTACKGALGAILLQTAQSAELQAQIDIEYVD
ncbi:conserved hypothetical protein [Hyphomicrobiales bacterium]|nr:conserved hypothetical protein [Hyphomicrobiales bacterium]CAH1668871.1 conserved hypothetical protein [Hyphomicrobiales bacterium]